MTVAIVGGGITGLATAYWLGRCGHSVTVYESQDWVGGMIRSERINGFLVEHGPESIRGGNSAVSRLIDDLGLQPLLASKEAKARFVLHQGELVQLPASIAGLLSLPLLRKRERLRLLAEPVVRGGPREEESVLDFLSRRIGPAAARALGDPMMAGIFAGDPAKLEVASAFSRWPKLEAEHGSLVRGMLAQPGSMAPVGSFTFTEGLSVLVRKLYAELEDAVRLGTRVERIEAHGKGHRIVSSGGTEDVEHVVITTPRASLGQLLDKQLPSTSVPVAAVHLGFEGRDARSGFGWLCPSFERADVLGSLFVSSTFPSHAPHGTSLVRFMMGGERELDVMSATDDGLIERAVSITKSVDHERRTPVFTHVSRQSIPQYRPGFARSLRALKTRNIHFAGWQYSGIGIADCVDKAQRIVAQLGGSARD